jgi:tetratricopeptide (TPR) repeat protein
MTKRNPTFRFILLSPLLINLCLTGSRAQKKPVDQSIRNIETRLKMAPKDYKAYAALGAAYLQKGRETGDADDFELAKEALSKSLSLLSNDPGAAFTMTQMAVACMAEHRFQDALRWAQRALALGSGEPAPWAIAGDALADVGDYDGAREAYSHLTKASGDVYEEQISAYQFESRMSFLSFVKGDTPQAVQQMREALATAIRMHMTAENIAWSQYQLGEEYFQSGDLANAAKFNQDALDTYPGYYRALAGLAKVRAAEGKLRESEGLYQQAIAIVPFPEYAAALGDLYQATGQADKAQKEYGLVEFIGRLSEINAEIHNRDLARFYADHGIKLDQAVTLARKELEIRQDIYTWDALAWALFKQGNVKEASEAMNRALSQGTRDAQIFFHAGMIYVRSGDSSRAQEYLSRAIATNPYFHPTQADEARQTLARLESRTVPPAAKEAGDGQR